MSALIPNNNEGDKKETRAISIDTVSSIRVPGGRFQRCVKNCWAFLFVAPCIGVVDYILSLFYSCPKIDLRLQRTDHVCVITGGARGIGFEIVKKLLQLDYTVILGVRNISLVQQRIENIRTSGISTGRVKLFHLDLKSLRSVSNFANDVLTNSGTNRIDLLINNAGTIQNKYEITEDDIESHFQVNYLSHFLLTKLLLPRIKDTARVKTNEPCHVINTSSCFHRGGCIQFDNLAHKNFYVPIQCYFDTKLCQVMHAKSIQSRLEAEGVKNILMYSVHPGCIPTDIWIGSGGNVYSTLISIMRPLLAVFLRTAEAGANVVLYPALNSNLSDSCGGKYYENGRPKPPNRQAEDVLAQNQLWDMSMKLVTNFLE